MYVYIYIYIYICKKNQNGIFRKLLPAGGARKTKLAKQVVALFVSGQGAKKKMTN